jgi:hypothetical protein
MTRIPSGGTIPVRAALAAARRGWSVFPLLPGDKRPAITNWERRATTDEARIRRCWAADAYNVGVVCGPSGLVVIDLDIPKDGAATPPDWQAPAVKSGADALAALAGRASQPLASLLDTYRVRTGSGGLHLYFRSPNGIRLRNTAGRLGWLIDTRAHGGYVVGAGSTVCDRPYSVDNDGEVAALPPWVVEQLSQPTEPTAPAASLRTIGSSPNRRMAYASAALRAEVTRVLGAREGSRNRTLVRAAFVLGQLVADGILPELAADAALRAAGEAVGLPPGEASATVRSGLRSGAQHPRREPV